MKHIFKAFVDFLHRAAIKPATKEELDLVAKRLMEADEHIDERTAITKPDMRPLDANSKAIRLMQIQISWRVSAGFDSREDIIIAAVNEALIETGLNKQWLVEQASRLTDASLKFHLRMQKTWLQETDCDRLDEAFAELDRAGIVARQNFACCITCGRNAMWRDIASAYADGVRDNSPIIGYVFFHQRDAEQAVRNGYLWLAYSSTKTETTAGEHTKQIAQIIIQTLERHGFRVSWEGEISKRILIENLKWQHRRSELWEVGDGA